MKFTKLASIAFAVLAVAIVSIACAEGTVKPTVESNQITATATLTSDSDQQTSEIQPFVAELIDMNVLFPADGETVNTDTIRVLIESSIDSQIDINGVLAEANLDGTFFSDLTLEDGLNFIEVTGINLDGSIDSEQLVIFSDLISELAALSVVSPQDGAITVETSIVVTGITSVDSVVQVNGVETSPDSIGIFEVTIELASGSNLIEVTAINLAGESVTRELVVFSQPE